MFMHTYFTGKNIIYSSVYIRIRIYRWQDTSTHLHSKSLNNTLTTFLQGWNENRRRNDDKKNSKWFLWVSSSHTENSLEIFDFSRCLRSKNPHEIETAWTIPWSCTRTEMSSIFFVNYVFHQVRKSCAFFSPNDSHYPYFFIKIKRRK